MRLAGALLGAVLFVPSIARAADAPPSHAVGADVFFSTDAEHTDVVKAGLNLDLSHHGSEDYLGFRLEKAWFKPLGEGWQGRERAYVRAAGPAGTGVAARAGTTMNSLAVMPITSTTNTPSAVSTVIASGLGQYGLFFGIAREMMRASGGIASTRSRAAASR